MILRRKYNVHSGLFTKVSQKRINESQIPAKSVSKENKATQLNKTKEIENNIFTPLFGILNSRFNDTPKQPLADSDQI